MALSDQISQALAPPIADARGGGLADDKCRYRSGEGRAQAYPQIGGWKTPSVRMALRLGSAR
jgi:hypothetical protein